MKFKSLDVELRIDAGLYTARVRNIAADGAVLGRNLLKGALIKCTHDSKIAMNMVRSILADKTEKVNFV